MQPSSSAGVRQILERGAYGELLGVKEDEVLDAKHSPYLLSDAGRYELAKDVSSFANAAGGAIVIGFRTDQPDPAHPDDTIVEVVPFPQHLIDIRQYYDTLRDWVFPETSGVEIVTYTAGAPRTHVDAGIFIPHCLAGGFTTTC